MTATRTGESLKGLLLTLKVVFPFDCICSIVMRIVYTHTDEAPALATRSLLPILRAVAAQAGIEIEG